MVRGYSNICRHNSKTEWHKVSISVIIEDMNTHEHHRVRGVSNWGFNKESNESMVIMAVIKNILREWDEGVYKSTKADSQAQDIILNSVDGFRYSYNLETMRNIIKAYGRIKAQF